MGTTIERAVQPPRAPLLNNEGNRAEHYYQFRILARQGAPCHVWSGEAATLGRPILVTEIDRWYYCEHLKSILEDASKILEQCGEGSVAAVLLANLAGWEGT